MSDTITVPTKPPHALLVSMAMRLYHDFGMDSPIMADGSTPDPLCCGWTPEARANLLLDMERLYEEIVGQGFYRWDGSRDDLYRVEVKL